ncbi:hypothetical protein AB7183_20155 [Escherichia coli]
MAELTKEWLKQTIAEYEANRDELPFGLDTNSAIELQAFKLALASLEAKPVAYIFKHPAGKLFWALTDESNKDQSDVIPVYAASPAPIASEAIENAIEYIRSIAFHIDEDDYHGKHIAYFMRQALAWLEGHSCSDDSQGKSDNSPLPRYQVIELTMLVKQLVSQLKKAKPDCKLPDRAMDYLLRNELVSAEGV